MPTVSEMFDPVESDLTVTEKLLEVNKYLSDAMNTEFKGGWVISCKEMALVCLNASCPPGMAPKEFKEAIKLIEGIGK